MLYLLHLYANLSQICGDSSVESFNLKQKLVNFKGVAKLGENEGSGFEYIFVTQNIPDF